MTDEARRGLYDALTKVLGREHGNTLMELLPSVGWSDVARQADITSLRGEMAELRGEMAELRAELRGEMAAMLPKLVAANIASMLGVSGLVLASASLA